MVNIDTVYQKVLVLANKEQRGYITPQEFNLLADKAQIEIFDSYFHDIKTGLPHPTKNQTEVFDPVDITREKLNPFLQRVTTFIGSGTNFLGTTGDVWVTSSHHIASVFKTDGPQIERVTREEYLKSMSNPLTSPTADRRVYYMDANDSGIPTINIRPTPSVGVTESITINYYRKPIEDAKPNWGYVVVKGKPLYNNATSHNFLLHGSEEENLVNRILALAGIVIMKPGIVEVAMSDSARKKQEQNS